MVYLLPIINLVIKNKWKTFIILIIALFIAYGEFKENKGISDTVVQQKVNILESKVKQEQEQNAQVKDSVDIRDNVTIDDSMSAQYNGKPLPDYFYRDGGNTDD